ncbi:MAG: HPr(Ser) kinase/phosphatase [Clostridium sp.]|nr:HPr(Ser) kinase/phosphatase [Clostridium sp.]MCM1398395.1 HPr(Ser) kinase/phosphatase [Clostridium sp.]MCM1458940.1 HPr(Ser) kinase/phosphatase [Bacteroides sp.]
MEEEYSVTVTELIEKMKLINHTPDIDTDKILIKDPNMNRPAVQLAGFFEHFDAARIQICGNVEYAYIENVHTEQENRDILVKLFAYKIPCLIFCRGIIPFDYIIEEGKKHGIPILTDRCETTSEFVHEVVKWLHVRLAPRISIHAVLVDVYGEGVLIMGDSGIGKSEAALELIRRGHRLVSDDVVEIKKVSDETLVGSAPDITRHFIELRGIGIIDVKTMFGVECVKDTHTIDLVINLEEWNKEANYDRMGLEDQYTEFLGNKVVSHSIPIRPGRNIAVIVESAAVNHRQKKMGYNAAQELYNRVTQNIAKNSK